MSYSERTLKELIALAGAVSNSPRLAKALSDSATSAEVKLALLSEITKGQITDTSETGVVVKKLLEGSRQSTSITANLINVSAKYAFELTRQMNALSQVEDSLFAIAELINANAELHMLLTDPGRSNSSKNLLLAELLDGKCNPIALSLVKLLVVYSGGKALVGLVQTLGSEAATYSGHVVAQVKSAVVLDGTYRTKIATTLTKVFGREVKPRYFVDESIIGSLIVRVGDEVLDGSVRRKLDQARVALTGSTQR